MDFLKEVISGLTPSKEEYSRIDSILALLKSKIKISSAMVELGGSASKDTWLKGNHDIDVYVKFNIRKYKDKDISKLLGNELKKQFKLRKLHGSRDYYQIEKDNYTIEIIPIIDINHVNEALNITDISPFHCKYVKKYSKSKEIRLAKSFCKTSGCYGAESYISGFSGYALEILTIHYGSFLNLVKNIAKWQYHTQIGNKKFIKKLNLSKTTGPLILLDPVDNNRNAAAALSNEKYNKFIKICNDFLKKPSNEFFIEKIFDELAFIRKHNGCKIIKIEAVPLSGQKDVIGAKLLKCFNYIKNQLAMKDFKVIGSAWFWNNNGNACLYFVLDKKQLEKMIKHYGPPVKKLKFAEAFAKKYSKKNVKKEGNRLYVMIKRKFTRPDEFIKNLVSKDKNIKSYAKSTSIKNIKD